MIAPAPPALDPAAEERKLLAVCMWTDFRPHLGQFRAIKAISRARFAGLYCGRRWGKSKLGARVVSREAIEPNRVIWVIAPTYELTKRVFRPAGYLLKHVLPRALARAGMPPVRVVRAIDSNAERLLELSNGTIVQAKSADRAESLLGEGVHLALIDESARIQEETWERYILPTLLDTNGRSVHLTTPNGFDWNHENYARGQVGDPDWCTIQSPTWENTYLPPGVIDRFRELMSRQTFAQEIGAEFTSRTGRVFPDFSRERHVRPFGYDPRLPVCLGVDFGFRTFAWVAFQVDKAGVVRIFEDAEWHDIKTGDAAYRLTQKPWARNVECVGCDPAGNAVNLQTGIGDVRVLREAFNRIGVSSEDHRIVRYSMHPSHRSPEWRAGQVRDLLWNANDEARLFVSSSCRATVRMFEQSCYPENKPKEEPVKDSDVDHARDALGYGLVCRLHLRREPMLRCW